MDIEWVFILWDVSEVEPELLPGSFIVGPEAMFWGNIIADGQHVAILVDAVPALGYFQHLARVYWAANISEEAYVNEVGLLYDYCRKIGGIAEGSGLARRGEVDGSKLQRER